MARLLRSTATLPAGAVRIAVVADTHSHPHADAAAQLAARTPDAILHAGDIGELDVLDALRAIAPVFAVRGNIDGRASWPAGSTRRRAVRIDRRARARPFPMC